MREVEVVAREEIEIACAAYAKAIGYYVEFHPGLSSPSSDKMREAMRAAIAALTAAKGEG